VSAALPVVTGREFDLIAKVSLIWLAIFLAGALIAALVIKYWRDRALGRGPEDPMRDVNAVFHPSQERLP
jgi:hypothetical protein